MRPMVLSCSFATRRTSSFKSLGIRTLRNVSFTTIRL